METITSLHNKIIKCTDCELCHTRANAVPGEGGTKTRVIIIGEAPGASEDEIGRPFVGRAGKILTEILNELDISREDIFITNIVKCRPPKNRIPKKTEIEACSKHLKKQIEIIEPELIITLGQSSIKALVGEKAKMADIHGKHFLYDSTRVLATYHPAAVVYNRKLRPYLLDDLRKIKEII